jgi:hypothetical protein
MASEFEFEEINVSEVVEGLTAIALAPIILPLAAGANQPLGKALIKEGLAFSERCQEAVAEARERIEDLMAEARAELDEEQQRQPKPQTTKTHRRGQSQIAVQLRNAASQCDEQIGWLTNSLADLRVLVPLGFGAFALRQLIVEGPQLDKIPWYNMAWYAFDSFLKLNELEEEFDVDLDPLSSEEGQEPSGETP